MLQNSEYYKTANFTKQRNKYDFIVKLSVADLMFFSGAIRNLKNPGSRSGTGCLKDLDPDPDPNLLKAWVWIRLLILRGLSIYPKFLHQNYD